MLDKGCTAIKGALERTGRSRAFRTGTAGLLRTQSALCESAAFPVVRFSDQLMAGKATLIQSEKRPYDGRKTDPMMSENRP